MMTILSNSKECINMFQVVINYLKTGSVVDVIDESWNIVMIISS